MASISPTAGGQYRWVSEFAPPSLQKPLSYVVGWCYCLGGIAGIPSCGLQLAGIVQEMVLLVHPSADVSELWQTTLIVFMFLLLTVGVNNFFAQHLPLGGRHYPIRSHIRLLRISLHPVDCSSRTVWAFGRDRGVPFSSWAGFVRPDWEISLKSLLICLGVSLMLGYINFGSDTAFNAVSSVSKAALIFSYIISVGCIRPKRLRGEPLLPRRFSLGRWGWLINDITLAFLVIAFVFSFSPEAPSVGDPEWAADFNWAIVIFTATCFLAMAYYVLGGREK